MNSIVDLYQYLHKHTVCNIIVAKIYVSKTFAFSHSAHVIQNLPEHAMKGPRARASAPSDRNIPMIFPFSSPFPTLREKQKEKGGDEENHMKLR